jgi:hypothetical protein
VNAACLGTGGSVSVTPLLLLETFVDPRRFHGTLYRAANWRYVGDTRGYRRTRGGYSLQPDAAKAVFVRPLLAQAQARLAAPVLAPQYRHGAPNTWVRCPTSLPTFPIRAAVRDAATRCGMRGYKAISLWAEDLGQKARARFRCCYRNRHYAVPSRTVIREVLTRVDPDALDRALQRWNAQQAATDEGLAIDGKTMCNAIDAEGRRTHVLGVVGHQSQTCHTQKKSAPCP